MNKIDIPLELKVSGHYSLTVTDTKTGKVKARRDSKNMLLNQYFDEIFSPGGIGAPIKWGPDEYAFASVQTHLNECRIGTGTTPPDPTDTDLESQQASTLVNEDDSIDMSPEGENPVWKSLTYTFSAGDYVGDVSEIGVTDWINGNAYLIARQLVDPAVTLTETDQLDVTWTITVDFGTQQFSGTIIDGQRNAAADINWVVTINNVQMMVFCGLWKDLYHSSNLEIGVGDSNAPSDLTTDGKYTLKGTTLYSGLVDFKTLGSYSTGDRSRSIEFGLEHNNPSNISIGEIVICNYSWDHHYDWTGGLCRITFDPMLDKATYFRVFINFSITLTT